MKMAYGKSGTDTAPLEGGNRDNAALKGGIQDAGYFINRNITNIRIISI